jgi:predicted regulator of Ras-like GTPase activity (Roadblock/LC7/MglB family)
VFDDVLRRVLETVEGVTCVFLAGRDGMVVASVVREGGPSPELMAASMADLFRKAGSAFEDAEIGVPSEFTLGGVSGHVVLREVVSGYLLAASVEPDGGLGRARFELRKAAASLEPELA